MSDDMGPVLHELAATLVTSADEYVKILDDLSSDNPKSFASARRKAYSLALVIGQINCAVFELVPSFRELKDPNLRPPASIPMIMASIAGACTQIAAADSKQKLHDVTVPSAIRLRDALEEERPSAWIQRALSIPYPERDQK